MYADFLYGTHVNAYGMYQFQVTDSRNKVTDDFPQCLH